MRFAERHFSVATAEGCILVIYIDAMKQSQVFVADMSSVEAEPRQLSEPIEKKDV